MTNHFYSKAVYLNILYASTALLWRMHASWEMLISRNTRKNLLRRSDDEDDKDDDEYKHYRRIERASQLSIVNKSSRLSTVNKRLACFKDDSFCWATQTCETCESRPCESSNEV